MQACFTRLAQLAQCLQSKPIKYRQGLFVLKGIGIQICINEWKFEQYTAGKRQLWFLPHPWQHDEMAIRYVYVIDVMIIDVYYSSFHERRAPMINFHTPTIPNLHHSTPVHLG